MEKLAPQLREGWKKIYPVKEENLEKVREVVAQQWEEEYKQRLEKGPPSQQKSKRHGEEQDHEH